jgi:hypothetical protein
MAPLRAERHEAPTDGPGLTGRSAGGDAPSATYYADGRSIWPSDGYLDIQMIR